MTMPPLFRAAIAIASISPWTASPSIVRLPSSSAVVPRMTATSIGKAWNSSHSRPRSVTTSTRSSVVRAFCLPPVWRGSTYVPEADLGHEARPPGGDLAHQLRQHALRERVRLDLVGLDQRARAAARCRCCCRSSGASSPGSPSCEKPRSAKSPMPDDPDRRQVARPALGR